MRNFSIFLNYRKLLFENGAVLDLGSTITDKPLANTLRKIASDPNDFYNGSLAESIVQDVQSKGGILTLDDLANYKVVTRKVLETDLGDVTLHTMRSPSGGPIVSHILNILKGFYRSDWFVTFLLSVIFSTFSKFIVRHGCVLDFTRSPIERVSVNL